MIKFQVSLIYIVNPNQPGGLHRKRLPLNKVEEQRTTKKSIVASRSYIPFASSLQTLHGHVTLKFEPSFHKQEHFFSSSVSTIVWAPSATWW